MTLSELLYHPSFVFIAAFIMSVFKASGWVNQYYFSLSELDEVLFLKDLPF